MNLDFRTIFVEGSVMLLALSAFAAFSFSLSAIEAFGIARRARTSSSAR